MDLIVPLGPAPGVMNLLPYLLLAASTRVELVDEVYQIPPAEWKYVEVNLRQKPALVTASFRCGVRAPTRSAWRL